jgi:hypothetical protein
VRVGRTTGDAVRDRYLRELLLFDVERDEPLQDPVSAVAGIVTSPKWSPPSTTLLPVKFYVETHSSWFAQSWVTSSTWIFVAVIVASPPV